jgi:glycosyltransferase involved in cell wall biosynthesis
VDVSVVVAARNEEAHLPAQLDALLAQQFDGDWELIVADNGSTDGTVEIVRRYAAVSSRVRLVPAGGRPSKSFALNEAVRVAAADLLAFCDADDVVAPGWLSAIAAGLVRHRVVTGPNELDALNPPWLAGSRGRSIEAPVGTFLGVFPCIRGNNWGTHRDVWADVGGMAEGMAALEDADFSLRCWLAGIDVVGLGDAVVHYRYRERARDLWRQGLAYGSHRPLIVQRMRKAGRPVRCALAGWRSWLLLALRLPTLVSRTGRAQWTWIAGNRAGQVVGSVRHRTLML